MPYTGDVYDLPSGAAAVQGETIQSAKWNQTTNDIAEAINAVHPVVAGGTGVNNLPDLLAAILAMPTAQMVGVITAFGGSTAPTGWLECDGAAVSRTTYSALFTAIGTTWGSGDGSTTFNVPDLQDEFLRGASGTRAVGTQEAEGTKSHFHSCDPPNQRFTTSSDSHNHTGTTTTDTHSHSISTTSDSHNHSGTVNSGGAGWSFDIPRFDFSGTNIILNSSGLGVGTIGSFDSFEQNSTDRPLTRVTYSGSHQHSFTTSTDTHSHGGSTSGDSHQHTFTTSTDTHNHYVDVNLPAFNSASTGGSETRPRNRAAMFIIRT